MTAPSPPADDADVIWKPWPGFQENALKSSANEVLCGGAKGPGKTDLLVIKPLYHIDNPNFAGAFLRESFRELQRPLDRAHAIYGRLPAAQRPAWNGETKRFTWPSRAFVQYGYARVVADLSWMQGGNWTQVYYDELGNQPDEMVIEKIISEIRSPDKSLLRQFVASANPGGPGHGMLKRRYIVPCGVNGGVAWTSAKLPNGMEVMRSRAFVPGRVTDNPIYANDPEYMAALYMLPERMRRCLMDGDWDAATGMALEELDAGAHLVPQFECPAHWPYVASFDWGFAHWWVFSWGRVSDDGRIYICNTIKGRRMHDWDIVSMILENAPREALKRVEAGHDMWGTGDGKGDMTPTRATYFTSNGIGVVQANIRRMMGYANFLQYLAWRETEYLPRRQPMVQWMDTPGNRWQVEEHLPAQVVDPDNPSDVLKVDADPETGKGGDDGYDNARMLLASRPMKAPSMKHLLKLSAWDDTVLRREAEKVYRPDLTQPTTQGNKLRGVYTGV